MLYFGKDGSSANCCPCNYHQHSAFPHPLYLQTQQILMNAARPTPDRQQPPRPWALELPYLDELPREMRGSWKAGTDAGLACVKRAWKTQRRQKKTQNAALPPQVSPLLPEIANTSKTRALRGTLQKGKPRGSGGGRGRVPRGSTAAARRAGGTARPSSQGNPRWWCLTNTGWHPPGRRGCRRCESLP